MYLTIITDCADNNAQGRQETRARTLFDITPTFVAIPGTLDLHASLEASGNIVDILDSAGDTPGVILANVAPRNGEEKQWGNGTPFGYFRYQQSLVVTTRSGFMLSLPKKLTLIDEYREIDLPATVKAMQTGGMISEEEVTHILGSQFRSFDFLPRVAKWLFEGNEATTSMLAQASIPQAPNAVWDVDNFGNVKTTLLARELPVENHSLETAKGVLPIVHSLKDVPDGTVAVTVGSSGIGTERFVEFAMQGGSASQVLGLRQGDPIFMNS
jgi:hypothetical protein